jgi:mannitol/fructose-specific phosphotransferase system IIA component (Ntr-type)
MPVGTLSVAELLRPRAVRVGLPGGTKEDVLNAVIDLLAGAPEVGDLERVRADVWAREEQMSTGVGKGLALPHARTGAVRETVLAFATAAEPVAFDAIDRQPVQLLLLIVGPEEARSRHIQLLGRVSRLMNNAAFRERLLGAAGAEDVLAAFREGEETLPG